MDKGNGAGLGCALTIIGGVVVLGLLLFFLSFRIVSEGHVGVTTTWGRAEDGYKGPGLNVVFPLVQDVVELETRTQKWEFKDIDAASEELQSVKLSGILNYRVEQSRAAELYRELGLNFEDRVVQDAFQDNVKVVTRGFKSKDISAKREEIRDLTKKMLNNNLSTKYGITIEDIFIRDMGFTPEYNTAIEATLRAQQEKLTATEVLERTKTEAMTASEKAKGEANAEIERAKGEAQANRERLAGITPALTEYLAVQKWDGRLPQVNGGATPFIDLRDKKGE